MKIVPALNMHYSRMKIFSTFSNKRTFHFHSNIARESFSSEISQSNFFFVLPKFKSNLQVFNETVRTLTSGCQMNTLKKGFR